MTAVTIRAYERNELALEERLSSLARRFPCLAKAKGIDPWNETAFHQWLSSQHPDSSANHAGLFLLNLAGYTKCEPFDILAANKVWEDPDKQMFINWMRIWKF